MDLAALIIAFFGTAAAIGSTLMAWTARSDALRAEKEAKASADRATAATERMASIQASAFNQPPWSFEWWNGDTYLLTNTSPLDAVDVTIETDPSRLGISVGMDMPGVIGARSAIRIMYSATMADPWVRNIVIRWRREKGGDLHTWTHPIPARPRDQ